MSETEKIEEDIDIQRIFFVLWSRKFSIAGLTFISAIFSVLYALSLPNIYQSNALLAPQNSEGGGELNRLASQYSGLASLAGIRMGSAAAMGAAIVMETLKSRDFFREKLYGGILVELMAVEKWDRASDTLIMNEELYDIESKKWVRKVIAPQLSKPSIQEAHRVFSSRLTVSEDQQLGLVTISVKHASPHVAKEWIELMIDGINDITRERAVLEAERSIGYLTEQRDKTALIYLDEVFSQLIEEQTKTIMLAHASPDYAFRVIEPPIASEFKSEPNRRIICISITMLGFVVSILYILLRARIRNAI